MWDQHVHTSFSGDCETAPETMIKRAIELGLSGLCFTDHIDLDYKEEPGYFDLDLVAYSHKILGLKETFSKLLPIHMGVELGLQPHVAEQNSVIAAALPFDFIIGSTHCVDQKDIYYPSFHESYTPKESFEKYFLATLENVKTFHDYDVYGHLDYIARYVPNQSVPFSYRDYSDLIDAILKSIIDDGKGIEMNMSGYRYGLGMPNPCPDILKRYRELGGEIITVGSDAHTPENAGLRFEKAGEHLVQAGFKYYTVWKERKPVFIKIC